eukprot:13270225-Alexandrium_andersonii.AAC.1
MCIRDRKYTFTPLHARAQHFAVCTSFPCHTPRVFTLQHRCTLQERSMTSAWHCGSRAQGWDFVWRKRER